MRTSGLGPAPDSKGLSCTKGLWGIKPLVTPPVLFGPFKFYPGDL